jgi:hypothetical protein
MEGASILLGISGIAVSFAGFASIVVAFQQGERDSWPLHMAVRLRSMIEVSFLALLFSILPFGLFHVGVSEPLLWRVSSAGLLVGAGMMAGRIIRASRPHLGELGLSRSFSWATALITATILAVQLLNAIDFFHAHQYGFFQVGLLWVLAFAALMFLRLVT